MTRKRKQTKIKWQSHKRRVVGQERNTTTTTHTESASILGAAGAAAAATLNHITFGGHSTVGNALLPRYAAVQGLEVGASVIEGGELLTAGSWGTASSISLGPAAAALAITGAIVYDLFSQKTITDTTTTILPIMSVAYGGGLRKTTGKNAIAVRNKYQKTGAVVISEITGSVADPDMVGLGHVTWNIEAVAKSIHHAILRKLFRRLGCIIETPYADFELSNINPDTSGPNNVRLSIEALDVNGTPTISTINIPVNCTLELLYSGGSWSGTSLAAVISNMLLIGNPPVLQKVYLFYVNSADTTQAGDRLAAMICMKHEKLDLTVNAHTVIQNRTKSDGGSNFNNQIDAQPLKGPVFQFSGIPKTKIGGMYPLNTASVSGVYLFRKNELGVVDRLSFAEPPIRKEFNNCTQSGYARIAPGILKDMEASKYWSGYFDSLTMKWRTAAKYATPNLMSYVPGIAQIIFLEEEMNSGSLNNIDVHYETQHTVGCSLTTTYAPNMAPVYGASVINNLP